ncbi:hypothetical protein J7L48_04190 [bacterium]|nr:hypothetical protein [bacterium]
MKKLFLISLLMMFILSIYSSNVKLFISKAEDNVKIKITLSNFISKDVISSLKSGEEVKITFSILKVVFLKKSKIKVMKLWINYDNINNKYRLSRNGKDIFFNTYEELLKSISVYNVNVKRKDFDSGKLQGVVDVKGMSAVSIFGLIYKIFFDLNYSIVFKLV